MSEVQSTQSWGSRIKGSLVGFIIGIIIIFASLYGVFWNESSGLHMAQSLKQTGDVLISVPNSPIDPKNNLKVVYFNGDATPHEILMDDALGISTKAIRLNRRVEMYQWQESEKKDSKDNVGGSETTTTTYNYEKVWSPQVIKSNIFHDEKGHENPNQMVIENFTLQAQNVTVGDFLLPNNLISAIKNKVAADLSKVNVASLQSQMSKTVTHQGDKEVYVGNDPKDPQIGDLKITVSEVLPQKVSIIAQQTENTVQPYRAPAGKSIALLESGVVTAPDMIHNAQVANQVQSWTIRLVTLIGLIVGFMLVLQPLVILADFIPLFGKIVGFGAGVVAVICGLVLWSITTAIAWVAVRPMHSLILIITVALIVLGIFLHRKFSRKNMTA